MLFTSFVNRLAMAVAAVMATIVSLSAADNWPNFRGSSAGVVADDPRLPDRWSRTENVRWNVDVPGLGWSSPIVWDNHIFVTSVISDEPSPIPGQDLIDDVKVVSYKGGMSRPRSDKPYRWVLYAINFDTGKIEWERELHVGRPPDPKHPKNTYASETPVTDGDRVYVLIGGIGLYAVDFSGRLVWSTPVSLPNASSDVATRGNTSIVLEGNTSRQLSGGFLAGLGSASSPVLHSGRIFVTADYEPRIWFVAAFDAKSGKEIWRVVETKSVETYGWATPYVWEHAQRAELIASGDARVRSYDPATGRLLWQIKGLSVNSTPTPFATNGLLYVASGYPGDTLRPVYAIRPGGHGDLSLKDNETSNEYVAWYNRNLAAYMASSLVYRGYHYSLLVTGFLQCNNATSGERAYGRQRISVDATDFTASPWAYNGKVFALSEEGDTYVIQAGPNFTVIGKNALEEMVQATPAIVRGSLIIRTVSSLWRIAKPA